MLTSTLTTKKTALITQKFFMSSSKSWGPKATNKRNSKEGQVPARRDRTYKLFHLEQEEEKEVAALQAGKRSARLVTNPLFLCGLACLFQIAGEASHKQALYQTVLHWVFTRQTGDGAGDWSHPPAPPPQWSKWQDTISYQYHRTKNPLTTGAQTKLHCLCRRNKKQTHRL